MLTLTRRGSLKACVRDLSQRLARAHGVRDSYSADEIRAVLAEWRMYLSHPAYAFALFASRAEFERLDPSIRGGRDYEEWRADVRKRYPRLDKLDVRSIAAFARNHWYWLSEATSNVDLPDSFEPAPKSSRHPKPPPFPEPEFGIRSMVAVAVAVLLLLGVLVATLA